MTVQDTGKEPGRKMLRGAEGAAMMEVLPDLSRFQQTAVEWLQRAPNRRCCLMLTYVDEIRGGIESLGYAAGMQLVNEATRRAKEALGPGNLVGSLVAGYIASLIPLEEGVMPEILGERLTRAINAPVKIGGQEWPLTASTGSASSPDDGEYLHDLFRRALMALSYARRRGGNRYRAFEKVMGERVSKRWTMGSRLRDAMHKDEFKVMYQPHVDPSNGEIVGAEALMRWRDGERGPVSPAEFVPMLEEAALIIPVGLTVMRNACMEARHWMDTSNKDFTMSVNLSPRQIEHPRVVSDISVILDETGLPPQNLILEITEGMLLREVDKTRHTVDALSVLGVRLVLDDFGTGYAALKSLKYLPLWGIKIDRSFVKGLPESEVDGHICEVILELAKRLNLHVVAEGVETKEQLAFMRERKVQAVQGFHYSPAVGADKFTEFLQTQPYKTL